MDKEKLNKLLDKAYELEGLIELALRRNDNASNAILNLILEKSNIIFDIASSIKSQNQSAESNEKLESEYYTYDDDSDFENNPSKEIEVFTNEILPSITGSNSDDIVYEPTGNVTNSEMAESLFSDNELIDEQTEQRETNVVQTQTEDADETDLISEDNIKILYQNQNIENRKNIKTYFTINDKFRFRRELFSNNDADFTDSLNLVQAMQSIEEAEDYFYNDLQWDAESDDVKEFFIIINKFFNQQ